MPALKEESVPVWITGAAIVHSTYTRVQLQANRHIVYTELVMGHFFKTQPNPKFLDPTQSNPKKSSPDPTQPIIDTWYGILSYTENFIQQFTVTLYSAC